MRQDGNAHILARAWAHKMQHFYNISLAAKDLHRPFSPEELASYKYSKEWLE